jgi:TPR repeat protein
MYELGRWRLKANPADEEAMRLIRDASTLGSPGAQFYLASLAETSDPPDLERARRLYRLCAAQGEAACQFNLANLTLNTKDLLASDKLQALAWLRLAALQRLDRARVVWSKYEPSLSKEERAAVAKLCTQLVRPG